ncbi:MAG: DUF2264 domain-containing protein [Terracidiphilus sp.]|jgi:hypothetical protein
MLRRDLLKSSLAAGVATALSGRAAASSTRVPELSSGRSFWLDQMQRVAHPVLSALSERRLRATMPVEMHPKGDEGHRLTTYLEAFARTLAGIAPWLELGGTAGREGEIQADFLAMTRHALHAGVDPRSPDYLRFGSSYQTLVDAGFLALAVLRAPRELNAKLDSTVRAQLADGLRATRPLQPPVTNWLLFSAAVEAALFALGEQWDRKPVDYALREHMQWYVGDGAYGDGPSFHWDYYNSFVIHPFLLAILDAVGTQEDAWAALIPKVTARAGRYAQVLERLVAPDGTFPVLGRSISYRGGAFHLLGDMALRHALPEGVSPEQVRCALSAVLDRTLSPAGTCDKDGWLRIGLAGHQPALGESYISTGSLYLCATAFLPLGLPHDDRFWSAPDAPWSSQKLWRGDGMAADHAIDD